MNKFVNFVNNLLQELGWTKSELARRAQISDSLVSMTLNETRPITRDFCAAIAPPLDVNEAELRELAGMPLYKSKKKAIEAEDEYGDPLMKEIIEKVKRTGPNGLRLILAFLSFLEAVGREK